MAIEQNRIEAAARALWAAPQAYGDERVAWEALGSVLDAAEAERIKRDYIGLMAAALAAAFPELASDPPTGWVAPWTETKTMWKAGDAECNADEEIDVVWSAMRDAHLKEQGHE